MSLTLVKALLILNAKIGWSKESRIKAALARKARSKVKSTETSKKKGLVETIKSSKPSAKVSTKSAPAAKQKAHPGETFLNKLISDPSQQRAKKALTNVEDSHYGHSQAVRHLKELKAQVEKRSWTTKTPQETKQLTSFINQKIKDHNAKAKSAAQKANEGVDVPKWLQKKGKSK